jgi:hypothetical protein
MEKFVIAYLGGLYRKVHRVIRGVAGAHWDTTPAWACPVDCGAGPGGEAERQYARP